MENAVSIDRGRFLLIGKRPPLREYLHGTWRLRHFVYSQARFRSLSSGRGTYLGRLWLLLDPFLQVGVYFVIFGLLLKVDRGMENFIAFLAIGIIIFRQLSGALSTGSGLITRNRSLVKGFAFPRLTIAFSESIKAFLDSIPNIIAMLLFIWIVPPHAPPTWTWFLLIPVLFVIQVMVTGIMFVTCWLSTVIPDISHLWTIITRFWFYGSGVIFPVDRFVSHPVALTIIQANPAYVTLTVCRELLMDGTIPRLSLWMQFFGWSVALFCFGLLVFWANEEKYNREF